MQIKRILCPTDFSDASAHAIAYATALAKWCGASLDALHVYDAILAAVPGMPARADEIPGAERDRIRARIAAAFAPAADAGVEVRPLIDLGQPAARILDQAKRLPADLVVIGTHGLSGFEHLMLGSVAEKVIRKAGCAVLTVPPHADGATPPFRQILCAVDFSERSLLAFELARSLARACGAALTALTVVEWPWHEPPAPALAELPAGQAQALAEYRRYAEDRALRRVQALIGAQPEGVKADARVSHGKAAAQILAVANDVHADLVVIGVHGRGTLDLHVLGSTANQVVRQARCGVLTIRG